MTNEQAKGPIQIGRDALEECLAAYRATNRTPETTMKAEAQLERIRTANEQANEVMRLTESATAAPIAAGVVPEGLSKDQRDAIQEAANFSWAYGNHKIHSNLRAILAAPASPVATEAASIPEAGAEELPMLPKHGPSRDMLYSADQMHEYARAALKGGQSK